MSVCIRIKDAVKKYGDNTIISDLSLNIKEGEFFTLLGPSGCGKTTLLRMIAGFNSIEGGDFYFNDKRINDIDPSKRNIGMVFQNYAIFPHMTVRDNVAFGLKNRKESKETIQKETNEFMKLMHISEYADRMPDRLSGGQQQRVALARALVIKPDVLLMDEPLSNLDAKLRESMRDELRALQKRLGITSLYVTHDQSEAMAISDRVVIMKDGVICQQGTPTEIYEQPNSRFVANFIGKANFIDGTFRGMDGENALVEVGGHTFPIPAPGKMEGVQKDGPCCLAVRPESILLSEEEGPLPGRVSRATYYGAKVEYEVMLGDQPIIVEVYNPQLSKRFAEGETVHMTLIDRCVRVLA